MSDDFTTNKLFNGKAVFLNYWYLSEPSASNIKINYDMTILPGRNEELSSASINGYNIGINKLLETNASEDKDVSNAEKLEASIKVTEFFISKNLQKKFFVQKESVSFMPSLFEDEEVCRVNDCELLKNLQPVINRKYEINGEIYEKRNYETKFRNLVYNYLFNDNVNLEDTIRKIEDITKIYSAQLDKVEFSLGFITIVIIAIISFLMLISLIFLFFENYQPFFEFLSIDSWFILIIGIIITLCSGLTNIGELTINKCHLKISLLEIGITIYLSIIIYELITNLPSEIKFRIWVKKHKYLFLLIFYSTDMILIELTILNPYRIKNVIIEDGHNHQACKVFY